LGSVSDRELHAQAIRRQFVRGDVNGDGLVNWGDFIHLTLARADPPTLLNCHDAADVDDDGRLFVSRVPGGADNDMARLANWLLAQAPVPVIPPAVLPAPFPEPGFDPTVDRLGCLRGGPSPGDPRPGYHVGWDMPRQLDPGESDVEIFLKVDVADAIVGFSLAYLINTDVLSIRSVDFAGTAFPANQRDTFEGSVLFRWASHRTGPTSSERLLLVAALFLDEDWRPLDFRATREGGASAVRLLRILADVRSTAPEGEPIVVLRPFDGDYFGGIGDSVGALGTHFFEFRDDLQPTVPTIPLDPDQMDSSMPLLGGPGEIDFLRGDSNADTMVNIADAVHTLSFLFLGGPPSPWDDSADANDDGTLDVADPVFTLGALFLGQGRFPEPYPECGLDPTPDGLECCFYWGCGN